MLEADPPDTGAEDNGANMNIKTLPGSARGQQSSADCRASYKMCRESSHRDGEIIEYPYLGAPDASLMGFTVCQSNDHEDHLDRGR